MKKGTYLMTYLLPKEVTRSVVITFKSSEPAEASKSFTGAVTIKSTTGQELIKATYVNDKLTEYSRGNTRSWSGCVSDCLSDDIWNSLPQHVVDRCEGWMVGCAAGGRISCLGALGCLGGFAVFLFLRLYVFN